MPQNMQRRPKVARLDEAEYEKNDEELEVVERLSDEAYYDIALKSLQHGMKEKDISNRLVSQGMGRMKAKKLVAQVMAENPDVKRTNAMILIATAAIFGVAGIILLVVNMSNIAPAFILIVVGAWFLYKGVNHYQ